MDEEKSYDINGQMTLYEINKQMYANCSPLTKEQIQEKKDLIRKFIRTVQHGKKYFMLLCKDISYYTLYHKDHLDFLPHMQDEVIGCLQDIGEILDIRRDQEDAVECWVRTEEHGDIVLMFFAYDMGVVECQ